MVSFALVAAAFGFALPHLASYHSMWVSLQSMTWPRLLLVAAAAAGSMASYWVLVRSVLPGLRLREAAVVNLGSTAVANTLPAGGALATGSAGRCCPVGASAPLTTCSTPWYQGSGMSSLAGPAGPRPARPGDCRPARRPLIAAAAVGLALLAAAAAELSLIMRSEPFMLRAGRAAQRAASAGCRLGTPAAALPITPGGLRITELSLAARTRAHPRQPRRRRPGQSASPRRTPAGRRQRS